MSGFIVTMIIGLLLGAGKSLATQPHEKTEEPGPGTLLLAALTKIGLAGWGLWLLVNAGAA